MPAPGPQPRPCRKFLHSLAPAGSDFAATDAVHPATALTSAPGPFTSGHHRRATYALGRESPSQCATAHRPRRGSRPNPSGAGWSCLTMLGSAQHPTRERMLPRASEAQPRAHRSLLSSLLEAKLDRPVRLRHRLERWRQAARPRARCRLRQHRLAKPGLPIRYRVALAGR